MKFIQSTLISTILQEEISISLIVLFDLFLVNRDMVNPATSERRYRIKKHPIAAFCFYAAFSYKHSPKNNGWHIAFCAYYVIIVCGFHRYIT